MTTPHTDAEPFDLGGALPTGPLLLEASAGTGKTYTISGLVVRWVAETDLPLQQLLVVTFTRAATAELRGRVRRRLAAAAEHLAGVERGDGMDSDDPVLQQIAGVDTDELRLRRRRVEAALRDVDVATISTIHGFCQHVLDGLGVASDLDRDAELVEDHEDLVDEIVNDLFVSTYVTDEDRPRISEADLATLARRVIANPTTRLVPHDPEDPLARLRLDLAERVRREMTARRRRRRQLSYDDLLTRLDAALRDDDRGAAARRALRSRYRVALVDEFQDTDPVQWSIVSTAFADPGDDPGRALVMIGDPKQAIYAFRGADVYAYLDAKEDGDELRTLSTSYRADAALLDAFDAVFDGATFGDEEIRYRHVDHAPGHEQPRLLDAPSAAALRFRMVPRHDVFDMWRDKPNSAQVREHIARDVAADIVALLEAQSTLVDRGPDSGQTARRPLAPRDIAVLVRTNAEASLVQERLREVEVPAVVGGVASVFTTEAATDWTRLLDALERPASTTRVRALAFTAWVGWTADDVHAATESDWDRLHDEVHSWSRLLRDHGVAAVQRTVMLRREVQQRLLAEHGGERRLADLQHVGELLHAAARSEHLGATGLVGWLAQRVSSAGSDQQDERLRRLETDDEAVQVLTVHHSKGLQFPVVYCPYLWTSNTNVDAVPVFHARDRQRLVDVGGQSHPDHADHVAQAELEARGEELRLFYVAATRAKHQVIAHYAPAGLPGWSGLGRLLLCRDDKGRADPRQEAPLPTDEDALAAARRIADRAAGTIAVETVPAEFREQPWARTADALPELARATVDRTLDEAWRRTSFSALTNLDAPPAVASEPDQPIKDDEEVASGPVAPVPSRSADDTQALRDVQLPLATMPGGPHVGTLVHRALEHTDFTAVNLEAELSTAVGDQLAATRSRLDAPTVATGLAAAIRTPLGETAGSLDLHSITREDRRDEVWFELPLDRHDAPTPKVAELGDLLADRLPDDDPFADYFRGLPAPLLGRTLRGYLAGSIDLVFRRKDEAGTPVFHVADYKTNWLGTPEGTLSAYEYRPEALAAAMRHHHYPLQALLYSVAAHRLLRWRLPGYDPDVNLGAVLYLFLRGMVGPDTPAVDGQPCGVLSWALPGALVAEVSDLLHGARP